MSKIWCIEKIATGHLALALIERHYEKVAE